MLRRRVNQIVLVIGVLAFLGLLLVLIFSSPTYVRAQSPTPIYTGGGYGGMDVYRFHDDAKGVTCWLATGGYMGGISCLPDSQLRGQ